MPGLAPGPGGLLSVALSVAFPRLDVIQHPALWCPDFPPALLPAVIRYPGVNIGILFPGVTGGAETDGGDEDDQGAKRHNEPLFSLLLKSTLKLVTENDFF